LYPQSLSNDFQQQFLFNIFLLLILRYITGIGILKNPLSRLMMEKLLMLLGKL
jgi:hypothetical protein